MNRKQLMVLASVFILLAIASLPLKSQDPLFENNGIKIFETKKSIEYSEASLALLSPEGDASIKSGSDTFKFEVKNFQLGMQTSDAKHKLCANSAEGQHIYFIMDNATYFASYDTQIIADMKPGHHLLVAFLSRSYYESLKQQNAYVLKEINVVDANGYMPFPADHPDFGKIDATVPHLFYSLPKGEYIGDDTKRLMLDFYLVNCMLSADGYKVRVTIDGNEFILTNWAPYMIEGLELGYHKVKLELIDKDNNNVKSPFNGVERTFCLEMKMQGATDNK